MNNFFRIAALAALLLFSLAGCGDDNNNGTSSIASSASGASESGGDSSGASESGSGSSNSAASSASGGAASSNSESSSSRASPATAGLYDHQGDRIESVPANDVALAVACVNGNGGSYTLFVDGNVSVGDQTLNAANANLTIQGIGGEVSGNTAVAFGGGVTVAEDGIFRISNGNDANDTSPRNISPREGAALLLYDTVGDFSIYAQYGNGETWIGIPTTVSNLDGIDSNFRDETIHVVNGALQ